MLRTRVMPCLLLNDGALVKTVQFGDFRYIGDPINTVRIFNELKVDELVFLDIGATQTGSGPDFALIEQLTVECFMPFSYGGGITSIDHAKRLFRMGVEKLIINTSAFERPELLSEISKQYGNQALIVALDVKKNFFGKYEIKYHHGHKKSPLSLEEAIQKLEKLGVGEFLVNSIDRDGTYKGFDIELIQRASRMASVPVVACGGAGDLADIKSAIQVGQAHAVAAGSIFVFQGKDLGVLVNFPNEKELHDLFRN